jgi:hypothetical protein
MTIEIELRPEEERALLERARMSGSDLAGYIRQLLQGHLQALRLGGANDEIANGVTPSLEELIDYDAIASYEKEADDSITLEEVRAATSKIKDSMARVVIEEERAERF